MTTVFTSMDVWMNYIMSSGPIASKSVRLPKEHVCRGASQPWTLGILDNDDCNGNSEQRGGYFWV